MTPLYWELTDCLTYSPLTCQVFKIDLSGDWDVGREFEHFNFLTWLSPCGYWWRTSDSIDKIQVRPRLDWKDIFSNVVLQTAIEEKCDTTIQWNIFYCFYLPRSTVFSSVGCYCPVLKTCISYFFDLIQRKQSFRP